jgi:hypothetical protein
MNSSFFLLENFPNKGDKNEEPRLSSKEKLFPATPPPSRREVSLSQSGRWSGHFFKISFFFCNHNFL